MEGAAGVGVFALKVDNLAGVGGQDGAGLCDAIGAAAVGEVEGARAEQGAALPCA